MILEKCPTITSWSSKITLHEITTNHYREKNESIAKNALGPVTDSWPWKEAFFSKLQRKSNISKEYKRCLIQIFLQSKNLYYSASVYTKALQVRNLRLTRYIEFLHSMTRHSREKKFLRGRGGYQRTRTFFRVLTHVLVDHCGHPGTENSRIYGSKFRHKVHKEYP